MFLQKANNYFHTMSPSQSFPIPFRIQPSHLWSIQYYITYIMLVSFNLLADSGGT